MSAGEQTLLPAFHVLIHSFKGLQHLLTDRIQSNHMSCCGTRFNYLMMHPDQAQFGAPP